MLRVADIVEDARKRDLEGFKELYGRWFIVKMPSRIDSAWDQDIEYRTSHGPVPTGTGFGADESDDPHPPDAMTFLPVVKRPGNPEPMQIGIGRSRACDLVLRFAGVSKLHASFQIQLDGTLALYDHDSANGTRVDGVRLEKRKPYLLMSGMQVAFAGVKLTFLSAADFQELITR